VSVLARMKLALLVAVALEATSGCDPGDDTWATFLKTGEFESGAPSISPTSKDIVYSSPRTGHGDIYRHMGMGRPPTRLTADGAFEGQPLYSPDGELIAYVKEKGGYRHVWIMGRDGSNQRQLTDGAMLDDVSSFSPDGRDVYFVRCLLGNGVARDAYYYRVGADGRGLTELPRSQLPRSPGPILSADGKYQIDFPSGPGRRTLARRVADGELIEIEMPPGSKSPPCSTPNRRLIVFTCIAPGSQGAVLFALDTTTLEVKALDQAIFERGRF
jgi:Tol biopolymer transport system component